MPRVGHLWTSGDPSCGDAGRCGGSFRSGARRRTPSLGVDDAFTWTGRGAAVGRHRRGGGWRWCRDDRQRRDGGWLRGRNGTGYVRWFRRVGSRWRDCVGASRAAVMGHAVGGGGAMSEVSTPSVAGGVRPAVAVVEGRGRAGAVPPVAEPERRADPHHAGGWTGRPDHHAGQHPLEQPEGGTPHVQQRRDRPRLRHSNPSTGTARAPSVRRRRGV